MTQYVKIQKNIRNFGISIALFGSAMSLCLVFVAILSIVGIVICCSIIVLLMILLIIMIKIGKISCVKIDSNGIFYREHSKKQFISWTEFVNFEYEVLLGRVTAYKMTLSTAEKSISIYHQFSYVVDNLIRYCSSENYIAKLKKSKLEEMGR